MSARGLVALVSACCFTVALGFTVDCDRRDPACLKAIQELNPAKNVTSIYEQPKTTTNAPAETTFVPTALPPILPEINISEIAEIFDQGSRAKALEDSMMKDSDTPMKILNLASKGRALNLSLDDLQSFTNSLQNHTSGPMEVREISSTPTYIGRHTDLSDVSLDNDDNMDFQFPGMVKPAMPQERVVNKGNSLDYLKLKDFLEPSTAATVDPILAMCKDKDILYETGDKLQRGCEEVCICTEGPDGTSASWECAPRCLKPYFRKGRGLTDPLCSERAVEDPCCAILVCAADDTIPKTPAVVDNSCFQNNVSHPLGSTWNVGCEKVCTCGPRNTIGCKPRCPPISPLEHCVNVQDPVDACCLVQLCDVSQDVHEEIQVAKEAEQILEERKKQNSTSDKELHDMMTDLTSNNIKMPEMASSTLARDGNTTMPSNQADIITSVDVLKNGTVQVNLARTIAAASGPAILLISSDSGKTFSDITLEPFNLLKNLKIGKEYVLKSKNSEKEFKFTTKAEKKANESADVLDHTENETSKVGCHQDGEFYEVGMEFNVGCTELCECTGPEERECAALRCPSSVGLDVLDPGCVRWAPDPPTFVPRPPHCCAERMRCLSNGSCQYEGHEIPNWSEVPISLTGCERRCFCESGSLDCQSVCESVPAQPPPALLCAARQRPGTVDIPGDDCCKQWGCVDVGEKPNHNFVLPTHVNQFNGHPIFLPTLSPNHDFLPNVNEELIPENNDIRPPSKNKPSKHDNKLENPGFNDVGHHEDNKNSGNNEFETPVFHQIDSIGDNRLTVLSLKSDSPTSLKMLLGLPAVLVGLRGRMDLRYTDTDNDDVSQWQSQVYAPADEVLGTSRLEFRLTGLKPSTEYKVRGELLLHRMDNGPISGIYTITTQDEPPIEEIRRPIDGALNLLELNSTSAELGWRHFSMEEQKYIDGIQIRYRPVGVAIYSSTELMHRSRVSATLASLRPDTSYEAALVLAPLMPPAPRVELYDERVLNFHTPPIQDMYNWSVILEATEVGSQSALVRWRGVAEPPERFVSVYRAAHACEGDSSHDVTSVDEAAFKLPSRGDEPTLRVSGLQPGTRCRVWLELFLTNGKTKTSNVLDILTKPTDTSLDSNALDYSREAPSTGTAGGRRGDYYVPLVAVAVVAALGALSSLLLLLVLLRRHRPHSVSITSAPTAPTAPRALPTLPPYENPAYKLEYQQETMDL